MLSTKVSGARELERSIAALGKAFTREQAEADLIEAVEPMVDAARGNVEVGPPSLHLRDNIVAAADPEGAAERRWLAAVKIGARRAQTIGEFFYGRFLEFGTVKQGARPWLRPAYDQTSERIVPRLGAKVGARVRAAMRGVRG